MEEVTPESNQTQPETIDYVIVQAGNAWFVYLASEIGEVKNKIDFKKEHRDFGHGNIASMMIPNRVIVSSSFREDGVVLVSVGIEILGKK